ncbi:MAG: M28 family peptidase, partial [Chloroflexi bacterium]|nr:M28 family peptidase [Chloroflexota bacterium]
RGWQTTPILMGELDGQATDEFVMFSGHQDSWHEGAMDNGSANATMLEVARLLAKAPQRLHRGLRVIFWSGHSHGRYSGSTWYVDNHWEELHDRCVAHVNVDSTGARGATTYGRFPAHLELGGFGAGIVKEHTGQDAQPYRMSRAGDMSFNGAGIPSLFMSLSQTPVGESDTDFVGASTARLFGGKMPWWWHTAEDTIDKVDLDVLRLDTQIYVSALWRLCHEPLLPMDFRPVTADTQAALDELQQAAGAHLDLTTVQARLAQLSERVADLSRRCAAANAPAVSLSNAPDEVARLNRQMKALSRALIPITYTAAGPFDHDPAWAMPYLPGLQDARRLAQMDPQSSDYLFLKTQLVRNRNAVLFALRQALAVF